MPESIVDPGRVEATSSALREGTRFSSSGFFVLRTPLLSFDELLAWGDGLEAAAAFDEPPRLAEALERDRSTLRARLRAAVQRPEMREALFVASPELHESLEAWLSAPASERGQRVERALVRYFSRTCARATPFGLFAGCSVGVFAEKTRLLIAGTDAWERHSRLDMEYLDALTRALAKDSSIRSGLTFRPSSSLYRATGGRRYVESRFDGKTRSHHLVAVEDAGELEAVLARAAEGAAPSDLAAALAGMQVSVADAQTYVGELVDAQILTPELAPPVTGAEPVGGVISKLTGSAEAERAAEILRAARTELSSIDAAGVAASSRVRYRALARRLEELPATVELGRLFQVDMVKPAPEASLGRVVVDEILRGVEILHRTSRSRADSDLQSFAEAFLNRYEAREVPLVEALDDEAGIGFGVPSAIGGGAAPLLEGLSFPDEPDQRVEWGAREALLLRKLEGVIEQGSAEVALEPADIEEIAVTDPLPLPDAFSMVAVLDAVSEAALDRGDFRVCLQEGPDGPSGARLLGRFCHADPRLHARVEAHLRAEEALDPEAVFAEVVHLPEGRGGNVVCRPVLREYEIPYLGRSGAPASRQIPVTDLLVSVAGGRIVLRSARLGRRVIPRLTAAHNVNWHGVGLYRFLCLLRSQGVATEVGWSWGPLESARFLPRVVAGRAVLALARWRLETPEIQHLGTLRGPNLFREVQAWRSRRRVPRLVRLADGDNALAVDLENVLSLDSFVRLLKERKEATLVEMFPGPDGLCVRGPEGRFTHELVVPFVRRPDGAKRPAAPAPARSLLRQSRRTFPPGSEWLSAKLYTGPATADWILGEVRPLMAEALASTAADCWFFVRYRDRDWHLRLRVHGDPGRLHAEVLPAVQRAAGSFLDDGRLWRVELDTYEREVERYGGARGIELAERLFQIDSEAVLEILAMLEAGDEGADERWRLALAGAAALLADLRLEPGARLALVERLREEFGREFRSGVDLTRQLGRRFARERASLGFLLDPPRDETHPLSPGFEVLRRRSERLAPVIRELEECAKAGCLLRPIEKLAASYVHMHINRMLRSAQRAHELVLYDFLARLYRSQGGRPRAES